MKKILFIVIYLSFQFAFAQNDKLQFGLSSNLVQLVYQSYGIEGIVVFPNKEIEFLAGVNLINGLHNQNNKRNIIPFDRDYMKDGDDKSTGFGFNTQLRYEILNFNHTENNRILIGLGFNQQNMNFKFDENIYVSEPPYYRYNLHTLKGKLTKNALDFQFLIQHKINRFFIETGIGVSYNIVKTDANIKTFRNYNRNIFDYGHKEFAPIIAYRMGYYF